MENFEHILFNIFMVAFDICLGLWFLACMILFIIKKLTIQYRNLDNEISITIKGKQESNES